MISQNYCCSIVLISRKGHFLSKWFSLCAWNMIIDIACWGWGREGDPGGTPFKNISISTNVIQMSRGMVIRSPSSPVSCVIIADYRGA